MYITDDLQESSRNNINSSFSKIFTSNKTGLEISQNQISNYIDKKKQLIVDRANKKFLIKKQKLDMMTKPILDPSKKYNEFLAAYKSKFGH